MCYDVLGVLVVLFVVRISGERWSTYGLKPRNLSVDLITGCLAFVCGVGVSVIGSDLMKSVLTELHGKPYEPQRAYQYWMDAPKNAGGLIAVLSLAIITALTEELVARGYLIPTLETLLKSTPLSVVLAAAYFGACHMPHGIVTAWSAFLIGIVFGICFVWTRRLWPLVFAHALIDFSVFIR
jgi:membrane protease YdiL (CAAX protease family)